MRIVRRMGAAVGVVALAMAASAAWASASEPPTPGGRHHCIATLEHVRPGSDEARVAHEECYASLVELLRHAGQGVGDTFAESATSTSAQSAAVTSEAIPRTGSGNACVARLEHVDDGTDEARVVSETCFATPQEALRAASGGVVDLPASLTRSEVARALEGLDGPLGAASSFVIGINWDLSNYAGDDKFWEASGGCGPGNAWNVASINSDWNNRISSAQGKSGCDRFIHFENTNYDGSSLTCTPNCATMGVMSNAASSLQFKP